MEDCHAILVIADISGYTNFIQNQKNCLRHAETIISELLESAIDGAEYPLELNKLEGDAALFYSKCKPENVIVAVNDIFVQVQKLFQYFDNTKNKMLKFSEGGCNCEACVGLIKLDIKFFIEEGPILIKKVRKFTEIAGNSVILIHRMMKNSVPENRYILVTENVFMKLSPENQNNFSPIEDNFENIGLKKNYVQLNSPSNVYQIVLQPKTSLIKYLLSFILTIKYYLNIKRRFKNTHLHY